MSSTYDPYAILEISPTSSFKEIKNAYYYLAKIYHPDKNIILETDEAIENTSEKSFLDIKSAFEVLIDKDNKHSFDCSPGCP